MKNYKDTVGIIGAIICLSLSFYITYHIGFIKGYDNGFKDAWKIDHDRIIQMKKQIDSALVITDSIIKSKEKNE